MGRRLTWSKAAEPASRPTPLETLSFTGVHD